MPPEPAALLMGEIVNAKLWSARKPPHRGGRREGRETCCRRARRGLPLL